jgi:hypothetical protein
MTHANMRFLGDIQPASLVAGVLFRNPKSGNSFQTLMIPEEDGFNRRSRAWHIAWAAFDTKGKSE